MKCPRTGANMKEVEIHGIKVDISEGCAGVWFDNLEFQKFDEVHENAGEKLVELLSKIPGEKVELSKRISCPRCTDAVLMRYFASPLRKIEVDKCPACGGIWLDAGELAYYRKLFPTEKDLEKVRDEFIAEKILPLIKTESEKDDEKMKNAKLIAGSLQFICPSRYFPGKQKGAAF